MSMGNVYEIEDKKTGESWRGGESGVRQRARTHLRLSAGFVSMCSVPELVPIFEARGYRVRWGRDVA